MPRFARFVPPRSAPQVEVLRELFPSLNPVSLVEGAPMLLALSKTTLRAKSDAWRNVLEGRVDVPWAQVRDYFVFCSLLTVQCRLRVKSVKMPLM